MFHAIITCTPLLPFRGIIPRHSPRFCYYPTTAALTNDNELCDLQSQQLGRDLKKNKNNVAEELYCPNG